MRISLLHTMESNRPVFEQAARDLGLPIENVRHEVRPDLRESVERAGTFTDELKAYTIRCLLELAAGSDAVLLTCATLGPAAANIADSPVPILRSDVALACAAASMGGKISVLCAAESAIESNRRLFAEHLRDDRASATVIHLPHVWNLFKAGDLDACLTAIASAAHQAYDAGADVVAFAHPWMAPAAKRVGGGRQPLDSPHVAIRAVVQLLGGVTD